MPPDPSLATHLQMSSDEEPRPSVVGVATSGIQDVSALLPLLGTDQCERLVTSALQDGLLYAAATPMSIFGSLGIVKAGFVVLWGSIDNRFFRGPTLLRNAGFTPSGVGGQLVPVSTDNPGRRLYVVEDEMRRHISKIRIKTVRVNLLSADLWLWNLRLLGMTLFLSSLGLLPYLYLIRRFLSDEPFRSTWLYPVMRVVGCDLVAICIQCIFQIRILEEVYYRLRFLTTDGYLKDKGRSVPNRWDADKRSKLVFHRRKNRRPSHDRITHALVFEETRNLASFRFRVPSSTQDLTLPTPQEVEAPLTLSPTLSRLRQRRSTNDFNVPEQERIEGKFDISSEAILEEDSEKVEIVEGGKEKPKLSVPENSPHRLITTLTLGVVRAFLLVGLGFSVVGYIGCFSIVQSSPKTDSKGSLVWLVGEATLAIIRTLFWAWNPPRDDAPSPIVLEKIDPTLGPNEDAQGPQQKGRSYGVGWMLESLTANDVHALVVGIGQPPMRGGGTLGDSNAQSVANYLQDILFVPRQQIVTLINADATKKKIIDALNDLPHHVEDDAPIIIYFSTGSGVDQDKKPYLFPYSEGNERVGGDVSEENDMSYSSIVEILQRIAEERTENIVRRKLHSFSRMVLGAEFRVTTPRHQTLILECQHSRYMGLNEKFKAPGASTAFKFNGASA